MISAIERSTSLLHSNHHHLSHLNGSNSASNSTGSSSPSPVSNVLASGNPSATSLLLQSGHHLSSNSGQFNHSINHHHHPTHHHAHLNHATHPAHLNYSHHHHLSHLHSALSIASTVLNSSNSSSSSSSGLSIGTFGDTTLLGGASSPSPVSVGGGPLDTGLSRLTAHRKTDTPVSPGSGGSAGQQSGRRQSSSSPLSIISPSDGTNSPTLSGKTTLDISSSSRPAKSVNTGANNSSIRDDTLAAAICSTGAPASPLTASSAVGSPASTSASAERSCHTSSTAASSSSAGPSATLGLIGNNVNNNGPYSVTGGPPHSHPHHHPSIDSSTNRLLTSPVSSSAAVASAYTHAAHPFSSSFYHSPYTADTAAAAAASASYMFAASSAAASSSLYPTLDTSSSTWGSTVGIGQSACYSYDTSSLYTPYGDRYSAAAAAAAGMDSAARRKNATRETTNTLKAWLYEHRKNPYPTKGEKIMLAIITKMTLTQVSTWFANARRRLKKENKMTWEPRNKPSEVTDDIEDDKDSISGSTVCDDSNTDADEASVNTSTAAVDGVTDIAASQHRDNDINTSNSNKRDMSNVRSSSSSSSSVGPSLLSLKTGEANASGNQLTINESASSHSAHLLHPHPLHHAQYSAHLHSSSLTHGQNVPHHLPFEAHPLSHILSTTASDKSSLSIGRLTSLSSSAAVGGGVTAGQHSISSAVNCSSSPSSSLHQSSTPSTLSPSSHLTSLNAHSVLTPATGPTGNHLPSHASIASHLAAAVHHPCYSSHAMAHHSVHPQTSSVHHTHYSNPSGHHAPFNTAHLTGHQSTHLSHHPHSHHHHHHSLSSLHPMTSTSPSIASSPSTSPSAICTSSSTSVVTSSPTSASLLPGKDVTTVPTNGAFSYNLRWNHHHHHQPTDSPAAPFMFI